MDRNLTSEEVVLTNQMMAYWGNFAKTGNPNGDGLTGTCAVFDHLRLTIHTLRMARVYRGERPAAVHGDAEQLCSARQPRGVLRILAELGLPLLRAKRKMLIEPNLFPFSPGPRASLFSF